MDNVAPVKNRSLAPRHSHHETATQNGLAAPVLGAREKQFASILWRHTARAHPIGRRDLHRFTTVHPTLAGLAVGNLIAAGLVRDGASLPTADRGRPQTSIEIDANSRRFVGLSITPGEVRIASLNPLGQVCDKEIVRRRVKSTALIETAAQLLRDHLDKSVFSVGVTVTGVVDAAGRVLLFSSALPSLAPASLEPIFSAAQDVPIILDNDLHALASRWLLSIDTGEPEVLVVGMDDGRLGASVLIDGKPQRGSVTAAHELGHTRLSVVTDECFCGHTGCLERIFSTPQLKRLGAKTDRSLDQVLRQPDRDAKALHILLDHLATGLANAVNFIRPARLVIASPLVRHAALTTYLERELPDRILPGLRPRVAISFWEQPFVQSAENAAWRALADVFGSAGPD